MAVKYYIKKKKNDESFYENLAIVSPDAGGVTRAKAF